MSPVGEASQLIASKDFLCMSQNGTTFYLEKQLVPLIEKIRKDRHDATRSDTVRFLILRGMAALSYLPENEKKALGVTIEK